MKSSSANQLLGQGRPDSTGRRDNVAGMKLEDGARVGVIGGGPAGSFFSYFLLELAERIGLRIGVDIYEPRDFAALAPAGCNMCGGIVSEALVQALATEGISLPPDVVQRGIDSYVLHMDVGKVRIETPLSEMRIAAVFRGPGPRDAKEQKWKSFDGFLQKLVLDKGANLLHARVDEVGWKDGRPEVRTRAGSTTSYDLVAVAAGVNTGVLKIFQDNVPGYRVPGTTRTFIGEYYLGQEGVGRVLGSSMHVFLLSIPRLEFAAIIPKGDYVTVCLLGHGIDNELVRDFLGSPEVKACLPPSEYSGNSSCQCWPSINVQGAASPFSDRIVFIGDSGFTRLYKDGIGAAYRTAKAAATTAVFHGVSKPDFERHYWPACKKLRGDNSIGRLTFAIAHHVQKIQFFRRAMLSMTRTEQDSAGEHRRMSMVLWDLFTGSASYREIFLRTLHPAFIARFMWNLAAAAVKGENSTKTRRD